MGLHFPEQKQIAKKCLFCGEIDGFLSPCSICLIANPRYNPLRLLAARPFLRTLQVTVRQDSSTFAGFGRLLLAVQKLNHTVYRFAAGERSIASA